MKKQKWNEVMSPEEQERTLYQSLEDKYGRGTLDLDTGTFSKLSQQKKLNLFRVFIKKPLSVCILGIYIDTYKK